jgi:NAD(P)-dependent dehydrogenase (short-subunit alcohol dehydrogenase family)
MKEIKGKVAVVTGAASGIGRGIALVLAERGCHVVVADIEEQGLRAVADEIEAKGARTLALRIDVTCYEDVEALAAKAWDAFGHVDLLFNNAGVIGNGPLLDEDPKKLAWIFSVNVFGLWNVMHVFGRRFRDQRTEAHICNTGSEHSLAVPNPFSGIYNASKHSVLSFSDVLRREVPPYIGVSILCPGIVNTNLWDAARNRPPQLGGPAQANESSRAIIQSGRDAMDIARCAVDGVVRGDFYIVTHPHDRKFVEERYQEILAAFDAQAPWNEEAERYDVMGLIRKMSKERGSGTGS